MKILKVLLICFALFSWKVPALALEVPILGSLTVGNQGQGLAAILPVTSVLIGDNNIVDKVLFNENLTVLSSLPIVGSLPGLDGRGLPVVGGVEEAVNIVNGLLGVVLITPVLSDGDIAILDDAGVYNLLLGGNILPSSDFLALDAVLEN
ncbi:hypothetical protein I6N98_02180 [Spongiibacter nanhainus]|uniref:Uncharacterized protein n=1 Tax=Spongiibacter nanhainus TaxID=2794344 RepID=A0A7T4R1H6_9GAMM|nr:hypothetical protein [Spongiibacter nanhainus]QQD18700.1 hypothetical protein I6N98_02180 [Spongiibacter nanhainus]